ncbi:MAG TPA: hypothetical protein VFC59_07435 [Cryobacterium sp.]|nr:hypothetical protein [Cryobacterium sp.]
MTYWAALALAALTVLGCYLLLRGRIGLALTAVRDDEITARASGVDVTQAKRIIYLISAADSGAAGGVLLMTQLGVQPNAIFSVQWSAYMIFIVIIGGIGYLEGPIVGAIVFFVLQETLADYGTGIRLVPVGYHVGGLKP